MKNIITYGTFDLLHPGHINLLTRAKKRGDYLIVGLSTDNFNSLKGKSAYYSYSERKMMLEALQAVDLVIPEINWSQKSEDCIKYNVSELVMGDDWLGIFDELAQNQNIKVTYLPRTPEISTTKIKLDI